MANVIDLCTLQDVKGYLYSGQPSASVPSSDDASLAVYITAVSSWIARYLGRMNGNNGSINTLVAQTWTEVRTGNGNVMMRMRARPISSVLSVAIYGASVPIVTPGTQGAGVVFDSQNISLRGAPFWGYFPASLMGCQFSYVGGYNTPGMGVVAALPDWSAAALYSAGAQINHVATGIVYTAINGGMSGVTAPAFPTALGAQVVDGAAATVNVASITESGTIVTVNTSSPHNLAPGQGFAMSSVTLAGYNGTFTVLTTPTPTQFTYIAATAGLGPGGGGFVNTVGLAWQATSNVLPLVSGAPMLEQALSLATIQETALVYKERGHVGDRGTGEPGGVTYMIEGISKGTKMLLAPYIDYAGGMEGGEITPTWAAAA